MVVFGFVHGITCAQKITEVDICVYGGTSAGVIAAYTAKMQGKSVLLIEPGKHLGGLSSGGLGYTDIGNKYAVTGLARDFYRRIGKHYGKFEQWIFEPHVAEATFEYYIRKASVDVLFNHRVANVLKNNRVIGEILLEDVNNPGISTGRKVKAKMFIDCSYEGDLMARAGVSYTVGRESNSQYGETYNGVQVRDKHQFPDGIDPYKIPGKPESGLLWGISPEVLPPTGSGDHKVQAYNFRICLSRDPVRKIEITQPEDYDSSRYELLIRLLEKEPQRPFNLILKPDLMPNNKTDINNNGPFSTDMIGMNYSYPDADYETRKRIVRQHENYIKGLLFFIGHSSRVPAHLRKEMLQWGYPSDEYTDNGNWSPQMYVREARRMIGAYVMSQANCEGKTKVDDGVGMAAYTMDSHNTSRVIINGMVKNEGDVQVGGFPPYPIAYRALTPKRDECQNLLVPVCLSATHIAYGSIRMEPVFMVLGQSSALAAIQAIDSRVAVQEIDVTKLQEKLKADPLSDGRVSEILIDNEDLQFVSVSGNWIHDRDSKGGYGASYLKLASGNSARESYVSFSPVINNDGEYETLVYFPREPHAATEVVIRMIAGGNEQEVIVRPNEIRIEGQTSGEWISLGKFPLKKDKPNGVTITGKRATGLVVADAVLFIPTNQ